MIVETGGFLATNADGTRKAPFKQAKRLKQRRFSRSGRAKQTHNFTGAPEIMECVAGSCEYKLKGTDTWVKSTAGTQFNVPGNSSFEIRVTEPYHYICHFG